MIPWNPQFSWFVLDLQNVLEAKLKCSRIFVKAGVLEISPEITFEDPQ